MEQEVWMGGVSAFLMGIVSEERQGQPWDVFGLRCGHFVPSCVACMWAEQQLLTTEPVQCKLMCGHKVLVYIVVLLCQNHWGIVCLCFRHFLVSVPGVLEAGSKAVFCVSLSHSSHQVTMIVILKAKHSYKVLLKKETSNGIHKCFRFKVRTSFLVFKKKVFHSNSGSYLWKCSYCWMAAKIVWRCWNWLL